MADEENQEEKKDREKEAEKPQEPKRIVSISTQRKPSKMVVPSKLSLKKGTESVMTAASGMSNSSSTVVKGPSSFEKIAKAPRYQNTYRLDSKKPFKAHEVYKILETVVLREVEEYPNYESATGAKLVQTIAADVRNSVRMLGYDRYKICVLVYLGEKKLQGLQAAFRALWDQERDAWTTYFYQCRTYFISCTCYGLYHD